MIQAIGQNFQFDDGVGMVAEVSTWEDTALFRSLFQYI